ncbi:MAG: (d)CMP kinase [Syntrophomonadaceae bacterium]|nr:(d)CMP kinase [Syntrophomonadaceae bacterium]
MKIAIDGPAGAGKSTLAKALARQLGFVYIDTGAMYRALTWKALQQGIDLDDEAALTELAASTEMHFAASGGVQRLYCDGENVNEVIRSPQVSGKVSQTASFKAVRAIMVAKQQMLAQTSNVIMDGRDIGELVLPDADFKFFLTASLEERAQRRTLEMKRQGYQINGNSIKQDIQSRDRMDSERDVGALKILPESIVIDTSRRSADEVLAQILSMIRQG